jgi:hypothetical protein
MGSRHYLPLLKVFEYVCELNYSNRRYPNPYSDFHRAYGMTKIAKSNPHKKHRNNCDASSLDL